MDETHVGFLGEDSFAWIARHLGLKLAMLSPPDCAVLLKP
jgi:hypothetical protein